MGEGMVKKAILVLIVFAIAARVESINKMIWGDEGE